MNAVRMADIPFLGWFGRLESDRSRVPPWHAVAMKGSVWVRRVEWVTRKKQKPVIAGCFWRSARLPRSEEPVMGGDPSRRLPVAVVVLNYRTPDLVEGCLRSLGGQMAAGEREAIVVDNCSMDESADRIESAIERNGWSSWARVVRSPVNGGFAAGNNVGVREVDAETYVLLNSDTIVRDGALDRLLAMRSGPVAIAGPSLEWPHGERQISTFRFRTPLTELISAGRLGSVGRAFQGHVVARELSEFADDLDWVSFACVAIRREVFDRIGLLDEGYFMYFEDMDFCRRARVAGYRVGYVPKARVVHLRGGTSEVKRNTQRRERRPAYFYSARARYFRKWYGIADGCWQMARGHSAGCWRCCGVSPPRFVASG